MIKKVIIKNFKSISSLELDLNDDINIIVGDNEVGKSTLLEAINLVLTCQLNGKNINYEISPFLFNYELTKTFIEDLRKGVQNEPPSILIELYLTDTPETAKLKGINNSLRLNCPGLKISIEFNHEYADEYKNYIKEPDKIENLPAEYYVAKWYPFDHNLITSRGLKVKSSFIDTTTIKLQSGNDFYIQKIISDLLDVKQRTALALEYRKLKETFSNSPSLSGINTALKKSKGDITDKDLTISIDLSNKSSWDTNLTSFLDEIPFQYIGKGDQNILKMLLALEKKSVDSHIVLIEEPENHLSYSSMSKLISKISDKCIGKQLIITTHSTFVLNKLGIDKVIIFGPNKPLLLNQLSTGTQEYFKKLPGYDTLRMVIAKKAILVEGSSDELFIQKAYYLKHSKFPIEDGIDVISVRGLSFERFLEIAQIAKSEVIIITDNDGDYDKKITKKYSSYTSYSNIKICADTDNSLPTLEDHICKHNSLDVLNNILGKTYTSVDEINDYMKSHKTDWALKFLATTSSFTIPPYIANDIP